MKSKLTTLDIVSLIKELQETLLGLRVDQVYDVDKKTYLIRLTKTDLKMVLVLESGVRFHTTSFDWPKNPAPSGFTMKVRKHLKNKRLEKISQLGADRIVDFQFGTETFANHILLELYDKGNIILTDWNYNILQLVRPRIQGEERLAAHEKYAVERAKQDFSLTLADVQELVSSRGGKALREVFLSKVEFGPALFAHVLKKHDLAPSTKIPTGDAAGEFAQKVFKAFEAGRLTLENFKPSGGFIVQAQGGDKNKGKGDEKNENQAAADVPLFYDQFHPSVLLPDFQTSQTIVFPTLNAAVDDFFSKIESQKIDMKQINQERDVLKKLDKVKQDQQKRLDELKKGQETDKSKAELISVNQAFVESVIAAIRLLVANQIPWDEIWEQIQEAKESGDPLAGSIEKLNLIKNQFTISLRDPYETPDEEPKSTSIDIDLGLTAYANATKYYDLKRQSAKKEERTLESQDKAFKSTEKKTMAALKEVATIHSIKKARKVYWFEKFRWFITSENYLVLGGRDAGQNELLVKRYMGPRDVYLHADAHGAPTVIIKNDVPEQPVLPKALNEAGSFAVASSGSWESKVVTSAWWVWGDQVSKSAPTGEYLPTGSFMIRGKKNYLPPTQLVLGFGFLFRLSEESMENHKNERGRRTLSVSSQEGPEKKQIITENQEAEPEEPEEDSEFPDTQVKINLDGGSNRVRTQTLSTMSVSSVNTFYSEAAGGDADESQNTTIISSGVAPISISAQKLQRDKKKADKKKKEGKNEIKEEVEVAVEEAEGGQEDGKDGQDIKPKRGQHGRNKKIKEKYRFQDEEERAQRMLLIRGDGSSGGGKKGKGKSNSNPPALPPKQKPSGKGGQAPPKPPPGSNKQAKNAPQPSKVPDALPPPDTTDTKVEVPAPPAAAELPSEPTEIQLLPPEETLNPTPEATITAASEVVPTENAEEPPEPVPEEQEVEEEEEEEEGPKEAETNLLNSLTGSPTENDELMFAVPVVAPYATLQNYKFKIKMVPGTAKRGKAAKSALDFFLRDKSANPREKDLLKSFKDQDLARNFPGKVKISTSHDKR